MRLASDIFFRCFFDLTQIAVSGRIGTVGGFSEVGKRLLSSKIAVAGLATLFKIIKKEQGHKFTSALSLSGKPISYLNN